MRRWKCKTEGIGISRYYTFAHRATKITIVTFEEASDEVLTATSLFKQIKRPVQLNADQTPVFADIRKAGHDGGDFLFVRQN